jgi:hypothetical protein
MILFDIRVNNLKHDPIYIGYVKCIDTSYKNVTE